MTQNNAITGPVSLVIAMTQWSSVYLAYTSRDNRTNARYFYHTLIYNGAIIIDIQIRFVCLKTLLA